MSETKYREVMRAELRIDCYAGRNCDQLRPYWNAFAEGDKQDDDVLEAIRLEPRHFPPGTKITVSVPCCPQCGEPNDVEIPITEDLVRPKPKLREKCRCGFDWKAWTIGEYS